MKHLAVAGVLAVALAGSASAADLAPIYKAPPVAAFSWTGCYVGGHVGGAVNDSNLTAYPGAGATAAAVAANTTSYGFSDTSFTGGVQYGCNRQYGQWVIGMDSSFSWAGINDSVTAAYAAAAGVGARTETLTQTLDWYSTTRGRLGWLPQQNLMVYVAGGLATGRVDSSYSNTLGFAGSDDSFRWGWTIGGGLEYALSRDWFLRAEYMYVDLGSYSYDSPGAGGTTWTTDVDTKFHVARVGLSYRFTTAGSMLEWAMNGFHY